MRLPDNNPRAHELTPQGYPWHLELRQLPPRGLVCGRQGTPKTQLRYFGSLWMRARKKK